MPEQLQRQITRVSRRLVLQTVLASLLWCWAGAFLVAAAWFLIQLFVFQSLSTEWRLGIAGGIMGLGTLGAIVLAIVRAPSKLSAALLLDEKFALKERVTTSLTLAPGQTETPAAVALLADVNQRVVGLDIPSRFPVRVSWVTTVLPVVAGLLALGAFYYPPPLTQAGTTPADDQTQAVIDPAKVEQKMNQLKKKAPDKRNDKPKSEELKRIEDELDKIANKPRDNKDQLRERIKELSSLENQIKNRERDMTDKSRSMKEQLKQIQSKKDGIENGPADDMKKALSQGKLDEAKQEMDKLSKKLQNNSMTKKEKEQLAKQLESLQKQLERQANQKDKEEELKKLAQEGKLDAETLKRELDKLKEDSQKMQEMRQLAKQLANAQKRIQAGDGQGAAQSLQEASEQLKEMELNDSELADMREQLQRLQDAKDGC